MTASRPVEPDRRAAPLFRTIHRGGEAVIRTLADVKRATIGPSIRSTIAERMQLHTDESDIESRQTVWGDLHRTGCRGDGEYARGSSDGDPQNNSVDTGFTHSGTFGEVGRLGSLTQAFATTPGETYNLTFWFAGEGGTPSQSTATVAGTTVLNLINPPFDLNYRPYSFDFVATSTSTEPVFGLRDDPFFITSTTST